MDDREFAGRAGVIGYIAAALCGVDLTLQVPSLQRPAPKARRVEPGFAEMDREPFVMEVGPTRQQRMRELLAYGAASAGELAKYAGTTTAMVAPLLAPDVNSGRVRRWRERGHEVFDLRPPAHQQLQQDIEPVMTDVRRMRERVA